MSISAPVRVYRALRSGPCTTHELRSLGLSEPAVWQAVHRLRAASQDVRYLHGRYELRGSHRLGVEFHGGHLQLARQRSPPDMT